LIALETRCEEIEWDRINSLVEILLLEVWCVGAVPQRKVDLHIPVSCLEAEEDADETYELAGLTRLCSPGSTGWCCSLRLRSKSYGHSHVQVPLRREGWEIKMKRTHMFYNE